MSLEEKLGLIQQLYKMAKADNEIKPVEYQFLYEIALAMEVPLEKLETIFEVEKDYQIPKDFQHKMVQIYRLALIMRVDQEIKPEEVKTLKSLALQMGIHPEAVQQMLYQMEKSENGVLDHETLIGIFKTIEN